MIVKSREIETGRGADRHPGIETLSKEMFCKGLRVTVNWQMHRLTRQFPEENFHAYF